MSLPAGASITTIGGKRCTVYPRAAAATNNTVKGPAVAAAAAVPLTSSSPVALAGAAAAVADASTSAIPSSTPTPTPTSTSTSQSQSTIGSTPVATSNLASLQSTASSALPDSLTSSTQLSPTVASSSTPDSGVTPSSSSPSFLASSSGPILQSVAATSQIQSVTAVATIEPTSSFETLSSLSSAIAQSKSSVTTSQPINTISWLPAVTTTPSAIPPTKSAGENPAASSSSSSSSDVAANLSSPSKNAVGVVMGGVVGGLALVGILLFFWWRCHGKRRVHHSLLTPLNTHFNDRFQSDKYEIDGNSLGPTSRGTRWRAQAEGMYSRVHMSIENFGVSIKAKIGGRNNAPTINMDRGNSQFLESIPQHSRSGSAASVGAIDVLAKGERFGDRWNRFTEKVVFNWRLHTGAGKSKGRSVTAGIMTKKEPRQDQISPEFSNLLATKDRELRLGSAGHRRSLSTAGLDFSAVSDPFADPYPSVQPTIPDLTKPPGALTSNPFHGAVDPASVSSPKSNTSNYLVNVQRSRGLPQPTATSSVLGARPLAGNATKVNPLPKYPSTATAPHPGSRYPSMIRHSLDSNRDTVISGYSTSGRKVKGRSDPFDLERPELLRPAMPDAPENQTNNMAFPRISTGPATQGRFQPRIESIHAGKIRIVSAADSYESSKYSSGASAILHEWGDSRPDLGAFALEGVSTVSPQNGSVSSNVARKGSVGSRSAEGVVGRAL
jgi:hypothetical protein